MVNCFTLSSLLKFDISLMELPFKEHLQNMEKSQAASRKQWRALVKKLRRKKIRQKAARERDKKIQDDEEAKRLDPVYQELLQQQELLDKFQLEAEERQQQYLESKWLRREKIAQQQFALERQRQQADEAEREAEQLRLQKELEAAQELQRKQREEKERYAKEAGEKFETIMKRIEEFLADPEMEVPGELRSFDETRPGCEPCVIYDRTNCCRFGVPCVYNHRRPMLSRIIVIRHFFSHPQLEQAFQNTEYGTDVLLEYSEEDLAAAYKEFFEDVVPELESFGSIVNVRTVTNFLPYLRGHMFVEYTSERAALNAFVKLQGRYYAKKRLNVEFSNIVTWRTAVCGLNFIRKCPQGRNCLYLHLFRNPGNRYNTILEVTKPTGRPSTRVVTPLISWQDLGRTPNTTRDEGENPRNWRWSESPEVELKPTDKSKDSQSRRHNIKNGESSHVSKHMENDNKTREIKRSERSPHKDTSRSRRDNQYSRRKDRKRYEINGDRSSSPNDRNCSNNAKDDRSRKISHDHKRS